MAPQRVAHRDIAPGSADQCAVSLLRMKSRSEQLPSVELLNRGIIDAFRHRSSSFRKEASQGELIR